MIPDWKLAELIELIRIRYPDWRNFDYSPFVSEEITYKRQASAEAQQLLSQTALDTLLATGDYAEIIRRLDEISSLNQLLWRVVPSSGDTAVLHHPDLDHPSFCTQIRNLLYGDRPPPERLQTFSQYLREHDLPNKWPFATYYLFLCHPETELLIKPRTARWLLKFMWPEETISPQTKLLMTLQPSAASYTMIMTQVYRLRDVLVAYGAHDMIDMHTFITICEQESRQHTGRLDMRGQIDLDVPPSNPMHPVSSVLYDATTATAVLRETGHLLELPTTQAAKPAPHPAFTLDDCAQQTGWPAETLSQWIAALHRKGQAILYGPPGTGKTYLAQTMARHLAASSNGFADLVQFHPAVSYESFVQGIRPYHTPSGQLQYKLAPGRFLQFCQQAQQHTGLCVLVIDEINRANLTAVFGELMYLLEHRDATIPLAEGGALRIPANIRLIGAMNTADRAIALVDYALRRRFAFIHIPPNYDLLHHYHQKTGYNPTPLITLLHRLNRQIGDPHYHIGITYFLHSQLAETLPAIWQMEIEPYLEEYFFDQPDQVAAFRWDKIRRQLEIS